jgi:heme-degrading monooxygenase HmoA
MTNLVEMDEKVKFSTQMEEDVGPVVFIKLMKVKSEDVDQFLKAWAEDAAYFKSQPGHISAQLHRGIGGSNTFINYAIWESTEHVKKAADNANLHGHTSKYPANTVISIHLFKKIAIPGICVE